MSIDTNNRSELLKLAESLGCKVDGNSDTDTIKSAIRTTLGEFDSSLSPSAEKDIAAAKEATGNVMLEEILAGKAEVSGDDFPTRYPKGRIPKLLPRQIPWEGRRMRLRRVRQTDQDVVALVLQWNNSNFVFPMDCEYADVPWPHYQVLRDARGKILKQKRRMAEDGRTEYVNNWIEVQSYPYIELGVTPGTEHLPRGLKDYVYQMYIEGFPNFTPSMWKQLTMGYDMSEKYLGIKASVPLDEQIKARRQAIFDRLGLVELGDTKKKRGERAEFIADLLQQGISEAA